MFRHQVVRAVRIALVVLATGAAPSAAQDGHDHQHMPAAGAGWQFMQHGVIFGVFNRQGGTRSGDDMVAPNWWMGAASRSFGRSQLTFSSMLTLEPAAVGRIGYREIFQTGEAVDGRPLIDRQHPHDLFMQIDATWRLALADRTALTVTAGPVGSPALGPVPFMHRGSAADYPFAPLGHHILDSTHISFGVVTAGVAHGP